MTAWKAAVVWLVTSLVAAGAEAGVGPLGHEFMRFPVRGAGSIAVAPTGDVWFTGFDLIGRLRGGVATEFATPTAISSPLGITAGPDGNMWFAQYNSGAIGRITPNGTITEFPLPAGAYEPSDVHGGPDGNVWFTALGSEGGVESGRVGRITPQGTFSLFVTEQDVQSLTLGPDGALWFTCDAAVSIAELINAVNIALGSVPYDSCANADADRDGTLQINDLIASVTSALQGCSP
jgi:streptogramin lyase